MKKRMMRMIGWIVFGYVLLLALLYVLQRALMYPGTPSDISPEQAGLINVQEVMLSADDGVKIQLWVHETEEDRPFVLYYHGNGGYLGLRAEKLQALANAGFGFAIMSYRGYGKSEGWPSEKANYADAEMALRYVGDELNIPSGRLLLYGESLGSGVAVEMATRRDVAAIVLEAPYTSVRERAAEIYRFFPVRWLIRDHYDSLSKIENVQTPLILFHGEEDLIIPIHHGKTLFAAANEPKEAHYYPGVGHEDFDPEVLATTIWAFVSRHSKAISDSK